MAEFVRVASASDIPSGTTRMVIAKGKDILVTNVDGKFYAISSICSHMGGPLEQGPYANKVVTCPWHGSQFDVTNGKVIHGPATKPQICFNAKVEGNDVLIEL